MSDLEIAVVVGLATLLGGVVGTAGASFVALRVEGRRQGFERAREDARREQEARNDQMLRERQLREAARLIDEELRDATEMIRNAVFQGQFWQPPRELAAAVYTRYRVVLAVDLDDAAWSNVSFAYQELNRVNWERRQRSGILEFQAGEREDLLSVGIGVVQARQALAESASPPDRDQLLSTEAHELATILFPLPDD
jgi:hypothetical protein